MPTPPNLALLAVAASIWVVGCGSDVGDDTPSGTVQLFLHAMDQSSWDPGALKQAHALLAADARQALVDRAHHATVLSGRDFEPWEMIAQGRYRLRFAPRAVDGLREKIDGDQAVVTVLGAGSGQRADVLLAREGQRWRIVLDVPPAGR